MSIIKESNRGGLESTLAAAQGRARERTIDTLEELQSIIDKAEAAIAERTLLPKKEQVGARVGYRMSLALPGKYKYTPDYTFVQLKRRSSGWSLERVERCPGSPEQAERIIVSLTEAQAAEARRRFESGFDIYSNE